MNQYSLLCILKTKTLPFGNAFSLVPCQVPISSIHLIIYFTGALGAISCNPFELVKTRLQASAHASIAIGHQHTYTSTLTAFSDILKKDGFKGLYKGSMVNIGRSIVGSGTLHFLP
jgi:hypothetical protein